MFSSFANHAPEIGAVWCIVVLSVTRSLKFILSSFYFSIISELFSTIFIILMIINWLFT